MLEVGSVVGVGACCVEFFERRGGEGMLGCGFLLAFVDCGGLFGGRWEGCWG